jgi:hypothetical protein
MFCAVTPELKRCAKRSNAMRTQSPLFFVALLILIGVVGLGAGALLRLAPIEARATSSNPLPAKSEPVARTTSSAEFSATGAASVVRAAVPTPHPTPTPSPYPTPTAIALATATPTVASPLPAVTLEGIRHQWQSWNNCGPATLTMNLSYFGYEGDQSVAGAALRRHPDDKNVGPQELAAFARQQDFQADVRVNGSPELLRTLLSSGFPVLIETWHEDEAGDGLGHYRLITGYDDGADHWIAYDTYDATGLVNPDGPYAGIRIPYGELDRLWRYFNRTYVLVYPAEDEDAIAAILGTAQEHSVMWVEALAVAQAEVAASPEDAIAWFNLGSTTVAMGDHAKAVNAFDRARALGLPWRMFWYQFGAFEAYAAMARYGDLLMLADETLAGTASIEELHYWRGIALAGLGQPEAARAAWQSALALNPDYAPASNALTSTPGA